MAHWQKSMVDYGVNPMRPTIRTHQAILARKSGDQFRADIIIKIIASLCEPDANRLYNLRVNIIARHCILTGTDSFYTQGEIWSNIQGLPQKVLQKRPIHESLKEELHELIKQRNQLKADREKLKQGLAVIIRSLDTHEEVRDALPDLLLPFMDSTTAVLPRTRPELYTLTQEIWKQQYKKTEELIYFYLGSRLLS